MGGPIYDTILRQTSHLTFVKEYLEGSLPRDQFTRLVDEHTKSLIASGMGEWAVSLLRRFPSGVHPSLGKLFEAFPERDAAALADEGLSGFDEFRELITRDFAHLPDRLTSIFPEETQAAYELSRVIRPGRVFVAGSYYAYLAVWMIPGLGKDGRMTCVDPDPTVCDLATKNMATLGFSEQVEIICDDAIAVLGGDTEHIDLLVIDAYGSREHPDRRYHGKAIYAPIAQAALPRMGPGSTILAHNADPDSSDLDEFFDTISAARTSVFLETTEHLAVFRL